MTSVEVVLRRATTDDAAELTRIAQAAKRHWGYPERWLAEWQAQLTIDSSTLQAQSVFVAMLGDETAGFVGLTSGNTSWTVDHLWVDPPHIGVGVGRRLFKHAVMEARRGGASSLRIESDPHATGFYERMGATRVGQSFAPVAGTPRHLPVLEMELG